MSNLSDNDSDDGNPDGPPCPQCAQADREADIEISELAIGMCASGLLAEDVERSAVIVALFKVAVRVGDEVSPLALRKLFRAVLKEMGHGTVH